MGNTNDGKIFAYLCHAHSSALKFRDVKVSLKETIYCLRSVKCYC